MTPTVKKIAITHPGVNNGLHAGSSCCVNLVYLGLLDSFFKIDTGPPVSDVLAPFIFPLSSPPFAATEKHQEKLSSLGGKRRKLGSYLQDLRGRKGKRRKKK
jgi:hypothetical protein